MELKDTSEDYRLEAQGGVGLGSQEREAHMWGGHMCRVGTRYMARIGAWQRGLVSSNRADP